MNNRQKENKRDILHRKMFIKNIPDFENRYGLEIGTRCSPLLPKAATVPERVPTLGNVSGIMKG